MMLHSRENLKLVHAFGYEEVIISSYFDNEPDSVSSVQMPWCLVQEFYNQLKEMAGWRHGDNKVTFVFVDKCNGIHAINFYDFHATMITFGRPWITGEESRVPNNIIKGADKVLEKLVHYFDEPNNHDAQPF